MLTISLVSVSGIGKAKKSDPEDHLQYRSHCFSHYNYIFSKYILINIFVNNNYIYVQLIGHICITYI